MREDKNRLSDVPQGLILLCCASSSPSSPPRLFFGFIVNCERDCVEEAGRDEQDERVRFGRSSAWARCSFLCLYVLDFSSNGD